MRGSSVERAIFLCFGDPDTCHNCGGWTRAEVDGVAGPFPGDSRFCSEECWESYEEMDARDRERIEKDSAASADSIEGSTLMAARYDLVKVHLDDLRFELGLMKIDAIDGPESSVAEMCSLHLDAIERLVRNHYRTSPDYEFHYNDCGVAGGMPHGSDECLMSRR